MRTMAMLAPLSMALMGSGRPVLATTSSEPALNC